MKVQKLTLERLNELILEVMEEMRLKREPQLLTQKIREAYVASSKPSFQKTPSPQLPKEAKKHYKRDEMKVVRNLDEVPMSIEMEEGEPILFEINPFEPSPQQKHKEAVNLARKMFQRHYRSLNPDVRYDFEKWLRSALLKNLSLEEAQRIVADFTSASKGQSEPKDPTQKPE